MEFIKRLWKRYKERLALLINKNPKEDDYFYLNAEDDISIDKHIENERRYRNTNALEKVVQMTLWNQVDVCVQTDISQENGYVIFKYDLEQYIENERKQMGEYIEEERRKMVMIYENKILENMFISKNEVDEVRGEELGGNKTQEGSRIF